MLFVKDYFGEPFSLDTRGCPFYNYLLKNSGYYALRREITFNPNYEKKLL